MFFLTEQLAAGDELVGRQGYIVVICECFRGFAPLRIRGPGLDQKLGYFGGASDGAIAQGRVWKSVGGWGGGRQFNPNIPK